MAKPRLIILIRHAQSEGNKNREIHQTTPDHRVKLTQDGWDQAREAGHRLRKLLRPDDTLHFFTSPYRRTRETTEGILTTLTSDDPEPSPFRRSNITVYEEPRLREQDFGNFQPCSAEMERMWQERADYGHFFYRIPDGESAADAYDRISGFNESLWRQFGDDNFPSVCVLVTHGLMSRVFLMKWYHFSVEYFEDLRNVDHCEFLIMRHQDNGKYLLETKLRTWSELRKERILAAKEKEKEKDQSSESKDDSKLQRTKTASAQRRWGGCPNGCNHTSHYKKRHDLEALRQRELEREAASSSIASVGSTTSIHKKHRPRKEEISSDEDGGLGDEEDEEDDEDEDGDDVYDEGQNDGTPEPEANDGSNAAAAVRQRPIVAITRSATAEQFIISNDVKASYLKKSSPHLQFGRDFGGTYSGHASAAGSDTDASEDENLRLRRLASLNSRLQVEDKRMHGRNYSVDSTGSVAPIGPGPFVNRLGDAPPFSDSGLDEGDPDPALVAKKMKATTAAHKARTLTEVEADNDESPDQANNDEYVDEELDAAEAVDRSIQGSVY